MNWAEAYSRNYARLCSPGNQRYRKAIGQVRGFVMLKEALLAELKADGIEIPEKSSNRRTMLETLLSLAPEDKKERIKSVIRARETCIPYVLPIAASVGLHFLSRRLGMRLADVMQFIESTQFEAALAHAVRQALDRTTTVGVRIDFVISAMQRLVPEIEMRRDMLTITHDREARSGEIPETLLADSLN